MIGRALAWRPGALARNAAHGTAWNFARVALQATSLVALASLFGGEGYGLLAGTIALFATCAQLVGLGAGIALVRDAARDPSVRAERLSRTRTVYLTTGLVFFLAAWTLGSVLLSDELSPSTLAALAFAEMFLAPALLPTAYWLQVQERMGAFGFVTSVTPMVRLVAALLLLPRGSASVDAFAFLYVGLLAIALAAVIASFHGRHALAPIRLAHLSFAREGLPYVLPSVTLTAGQEIDKTLVLQLAGAAAAGPYAAACRIAQAAVLPVNSLVLTAAPRLFRAFSSGSGNRTLQPLIVAAGVYGCLAALALYLLAPAVPLLLGADFSSAVVTLRLLCLLVITSSLRQVIMAGLTTNDAQQRRNLVELLAVATMVALCISFVPRFGVSAAALSLIVADLVALLAGAIALLYMPRSTADEASSLVTAGAAKRGTSTLRSLLRRLEYSGTGRWIYTRQVLHWVVDRQVTRQLPFGLRVFCAYCALYLNVLPFPTIVFGHGLYAWSRWLSRRQLGSGCTRLRLAGQDVYVDLRDPGALYAIKEITGRSWQRAALESLLTQGATFVDVGANQGAFTAIAAKTLGASGRIIAIEPQPALVRCIESSLAAATVPSWRVHQCAVGETSGVGTMVIPRENAGEARLEGGTPEARDAQISVLVRTLDALLEDVEADRPCVVKMDIEGGELYALRGARRSLQRLRPTLLLEINPDAMKRRGYSAEELREELSSVGYTAWSLLDDPDVRWPLSQMPLDSYTDVILWHG